MKKQTWKSQQEKAKLIKDKMKLNEVISYGDDFDFLNEYFKNHPEYNIKFSRGCIGYIKRNMNEWGNNNFSICIIHDSYLETPISYKFNKKGINKKQEVIKAFRSAIYPDIKDFINKYFEPNKTKCALSNKTITGSCYFEVDHYDLDFRDAVDLFMVGKNYEDLYLKVVKEKTKRVFNDINLINEWRYFHNKKTQLRFLLKEEHDKRSKQQRLKKRS